jgi:hypothetical protein
MDDLLPRKVTKEEKIDDILAGAINKAKDVIEALGNYNELPADETVELEGEEVKLTKPKAEKVSDAKGGDEQADNRTSRDVKKAPYNMGEHDASHDSLIEDRLDSILGGADGFDERAKKIQVSNTAPTYDVPIRISEWRKLMPVVRNDKNLLIETFKKLYGVSQVELNIDETKRPHPHNPNVEQGTITFTR